MANEDDRKLATLQAVAKKEGDDRTKKDGPPKKKGHGATSDKKKKAEDELSEEDQKIKENMELLVERLQDPDPGVATLALQTLSCELKAATSSMTSVPKPLKFLRPHIPVLYAHYKSLSSSDPIKADYAMILAVLCTTCGDGKRRSLHFCLEADCKDMTSWGFEFLRNLAGEVASAYSELQTGGDEEHHKEHITDEEEGERGGGSSRKTSTQSRQTIEKEGGKDHDDKKDSGQQKNIQKSTTKEYKRKDMGNGHGGDVEEGEGERGGGGGDDANDVVMEDVEHVADSGGSSSNRNSTSTLLAKTIDTDTHGRSSDDSSRSRSSGDSTSEKTTSGSVVKKSLGIEKEGRGGEGGEGGKEINQIEREEGDDNNKKKGKDMTLPTSSSSTTTTAAALSSEALEEKARAFRRWTPPLPSVEDLIRVVNLILPYYMTHNAEIEGVDLLSEVDRVESLAQYIDSSNYKKVTAYVLSMAQYAGGSDEYLRLLKVAYAVLLQQKEYFDAMRVALRIAAASPMPTSLTFGGEKDAGPDILDAVEKQNQQQKQQQGQAQEHQAQQGGSRTNSTTGSSSSNNSGSGKGEVGGVGGEKNEGVAVVTGVVDRVRQVLRCCRGKKLLLKQLALLLARHRYDCEFVDEQLQRLSSGEELSRYFLLLAKETDVLEPKAPEEVYKTHLEDPPAGAASLSMPTTTTTRRSGAATAAASGGSGGAGGTSGSSSSSTTGGGGTGSSAAAAGTAGTAAAAAAGAFLDSARQNLASTFVNAFVNAGFCKDKLMLAEGGAWLYKNKDHGMISAAASLGAILLWNVDEGLSHLDKYQYSSDCNIKAGALLGFGVLSSNVRHECDAAFALLKEHLEDSLDGGASSSVQQKIAAAIGLGCAYAGSKRQDVMEILTVLVVDGALPIELSAFAAASLGLVFVGSCNQEAAEAILTTLIDRSAVEKGLDSPLCIYFALGLGLLFLGTRDACEPTLTALEALPSSAAAAWSSNSDESIAVNTSSNDSNNSDSSNSSSNTTSSSSSSNNSSNSSNRSKNNSSSNTNSTSNNSSTTSSSSNNSSSGSGSSSSTESMDDENTSSPDDGFNNNNERKTSTDGDGGNNNGGSGSGSSSSNGSSTGAAAATATGEGTSHSNSSNSSNNNNNLSSSSSSSSGSSSSSNSSSNNNNSNGSNSSSNMNSMGSTNRNSREQLRRRRQQLLSAQVLSLYAQRTVEGMAFAGSGDVLKVQKFLSICGEPRDQLFWSELLKKSAGDSSSPRSRGGGEGRREEQGAPEGRDGEGERGGATTTTIPGSGDGGGTGGSSSSSGGGGGTCINGSAGGSEGSTNNSGAANNNSGGGEISNSSNNNSSRSDGARPATTGTGGAGGGGGPGGAASSGDSGGSGNSNNSSGERDAGQINAAQQRPSNNRRINNNTTPTGSSNSSGSGGSSSSGGGGGGSRRRESGMSTSAAAAATTRGGLGFDYDDLESDEEDDGDEEDGSRKLDQAVAVMNVALLSFAEDVGADMTLRVLDHILQYGELPQRRAVPLALALHSASRAKPGVIDTLSKLSHDIDADVALNAIFAMGIVGAGTNNARIAGLLRSLASYYGKDSSALFVIRLAQGLLYMGKGLLTINALHSDRFLINNVALGCLCIIVHTCMHMHHTFLGRFHYLLYYLFPAAHPRMLFTVAPISALPQGATGAGEASYELDKTSESSSNNSSSSSSKSKSSSDGGATTLTNGEGGGGGGGGPQQKTAAPHDVQVEMTDSTNGKEKKEEGSSSSSSSAAGGAGGSGSGKEGGSGSRSGTGSSSSSGGDVCVEVDEAEEEAEEERRLGEEELEMLCTPARVGEAVDIVGQVGRQPKTITAFQTHTTPVLLGYSERAELATDEYIPVASVLEGVVILKKNPHYKPPRLP